MDPAELPPTLRLLYPFRPRRVAVGPGELSVVDHGDGPAVVCLHGNPTWSFFYRDLIAEAGHPGFRWIAPDHLGCGFSDRQPRPQRLADHAAHLERALAELGVEEYFLVAHDWGGAIGATVAGRQPERVRGLVFLNTAAFPFGWMPWQIRAVRTPLLGRYLMIRHNLFARAAIRMAVEHPLPEAVAEGFLLPYGTPDRRAAIAQFVADIPMRPSHPSYATLEACGENLARLRDKPCLLAWGLADFCFRGRFLREFQRRFPRAEVEERPQAGHYLLEDAGRELRDRIRSFLASAAA